MTYCDAKEKERERERKTIVVNSNAAAVVERRHFLCCCVVCVNFYLLQIKKAENKLARVSVAYFIVLLRGQLQKRQSVQLDASTVIGQFGAQLAHRDASVLF